MRFSDEICSLFKNAKQLLVGSQMQLKSACRVLWGLMELVETANQLATCAPESIESLSVIARSSVMALSARVLGTNK